MKEQVPTILLKTIDQMSYQMEKISSAARKVVEQPIRLNSNKSLVSEITQRYFSEIQKDVIQIYSAILSASNLWKSLFPDLKKGIENNNQQHVISGMKILKKEHLNKLERFHEIREMLKEYLNQLNLYTLNKNDLSGKTYQSFIQQIEQLIAITNALIISWENWIETFHLEYRDSLEEIHLIWLEIDQKIKTTNDYY